MSDTTNLMSELRTGLMAVAAFCRGTVDMEPRMDAALNALDRVEVLVARNAELEAERNMIDQMRRSQAQISADLNDAMLKLGAERDRLQEVLRLKYGDVLAERDRLKAVLDQLSIPEDARAAALRVRSTP